ncbi:hypothetical protein RI129_000622 [Pyrocoelia pectoralis]|uniref:Reverse transcriptase domain-containing protein n=1 Tax=Pyrocoelia pectoralis TaxID=417401 RepID=A0AAN7VTC0_9COLE
MHSTYFTYKNQFYKQVQGGPMDSPLSPAIANVYIENFEHKALSSINLKPKCWYRYVDDTFVVWPHGLDNLNKFLQHINNIHPNIQFTMEVESDKKLTFLDMLIERHDDGTFKHKLYRKITYSNRYLNAQSHHHPCQLYGIVKSLTIRSIRLSDEESKNDELEKITKMLQQNGYPLTKIKSIIKKYINVAQKSTKTLMSPKNWLFYLT